MQTIKNDQKQQYNSKDTIRNKHCKSKDLVHALYKVETILTHILEVNFH